MKKRTDFFYKLSFSNKLFIIFLPLIFIFIIITGSACLYISEQQLRINTQTLMENSVHQTRILVDDKLDAMMMKSASIVNSAAYNYFVFSYKKEDPIGKEYLDRRNDLYQQMTNTAIDYWNLIDSIVLIEKSGNSMVYMSSPAPYIKKDTYQTLLEKISVETDPHNMFRYIWQNQHDDTLLVTRSPRSVLSLLTVSGNADSSSGAVLAINIRSDFFISILQNIVTAKGSFSALLSPESTCFYGDSVDEWRLTEQDTLQLLNSTGKGSFITRDTNGKQIMLSYEKLNTNNWILVNGVPLDSIMTGTELMRNMVLILVIFMLLISAVPVLFLSRWISRDISVLAEQIEQYKIGNEIQTFHTRDQKELHQVADALNRMVSTIQGQVSEMMQIETRKRKAELLLLQSQINPHFLYNTLISVKTLIELNRSQMAGSMFQSLIDFYSLSLNHGKERLSIHQELEIIRNYLDILSVRYNHSFEWFINVDEDVLNCEILTLTLQPLVENAVHHGIKDKAGPGKIEITGCRLDDTILLTVWDNGIGIPADKLDALRESLNQEVLPEGRESIHFGLWNSHQRLKLFFGPKYGITIDSSPGNYTSVTVIIPDILFED